MTSPVVTSGFPPPFIVAAATALHEQKLNTACIMKHVCSETLLKSGRFLALSDPNWLHIIKDCVEVDLAWVTNSQKTFFLSDELTAHAHDSSTALQSFFYELLDHRVPV